MHKSASDNTQARADEANQRILENRKVEKNTTCAVNATESGIMEVETGRMAFNPDIKEFAVRMQKLNT